MSESGEKQFDPTPARLAKAKRDGDIPRASELGANCSLLAGTCATAAIVPFIGMEFAGTLAAASRMGPVSAVVTMCGVVVALGLVPMLAAAIAGVAVSLIQSGGIVPSAPALKFERVDPFAGIKRIASRQTVAQCIRATLACAVATCAIAGTLVPLAGIAFQRVPPAALASIAWHAVLQSIFSACAVGLSFAIVEYGTARNAWLKRLRMSFDEYKRSMKDQDGDAQLRGRRRSFHRALARGDLRQVRKAAFVVCNPTHVAIALAYAPPEEPVPRVLVRAADDLAFRVRDIAVEHHVPLIENIELARALYADAVTGSPIPPDHYVAVAAIVAMLQKKAVRHGRRV